jgi:hypothetical protein
VISRFTEALRGHVPVAGSLAAADTPLASANDNPAAPNIGRVLLCCEAFFTRDMAILQGRDISATIQQVMSV